MKSKTFLVLLCASVGLHAMELSLTRCNAVTAEEIAANEARIEELKRQSENLCTANKMIKALQADLGWEKVLDQVKTKHGFQLFPNRVLLKCDDHVVALIKALVSQIEDGRLDITSLHDDALCDAYLASLVDEYGEAVDAPGAVVSCIFKPLVGDSQKKEFTDLEQIVVSYILHWLLVFKRDDCIAVFFAAKYALLSKGGV